MVFQKGIFVWVFIFMGYSLFGQSHLKELVKEYQNEKDSNKKLDILNKLSYQYVAFSADTAVLYSQKQIDLSEALGNTEYLVSGYMHLGIAFEYKGELNQALRYHKKALRTLEVHNIKKDELLSNVYNAIGISYDYLGKYDLAIGYYQKALKIYKRMKNQKAIAHGSSNLGLVYFYKGDVAKGIYYLEKSLALCKKLKDDEGLATAYSNLGMIYEHQKNTGKALEYYTNAKIIYEKLNAPADLAIIYNNLSAILINSDVEKSIEYNLKSIYYKRVSGNTIEMSSSYGNLGLCYLVKKDTTTALLYYDSAYLSAKQIGSPELIIQSCNKSAELMLQVKQPDKAKPYLDEAVQLMEETPEFYSYFNTYKMLSNYNKQKGQHQKAMHYLEKYYDARDKVIQSENDKKMMAAELEAEYEQKKQRDDFKRKQDRLKQIKEQEKREIVIWGLAIAVMAFIAFVLFLARANRKKQKTNVLLKEQNDQIVLQKHIIEEKNKDITDSIQYAKRLQEGILPESAYITNLFKNQFVFFAPKDIVSGDFYWFDRIGDKTFFACVDCTGHGVPGGFMSMLGYNAIHSALHEYGCTKPNAILDKTSELIIENFSKQKREIRDGMDLALMSIKPTEKGYVLEFAGAQNGLWIITKSLIENADPDLSYNGFYLYELKGDNQPIGYYENRQPFTLHKLFLQKGDLIVASTDGYPDQFGGPKGKKFKSSNLKKLLVEHAHMSMYDIHQQLESSFQLWKADLEQIDDVCVVGVKL